MDHTSALECLQAWFEAMPPGETLKVPADIFKKAFLVSGVGPAIGLDTDGAKVWGRYMFYDLYPEWEAIGFIHADRQDDHYRVTKPMEKPKPPEVKPEEKLITIELRPVEAHRLLAILWEIRSFCSKREDPLLFGVLETFCTLIGDQIKKREG